jgi:hypothetical protein
MNHPVISGIRYHFIYSLELTLSFSLYLIGGWGWRWSSSLPGKIVSAHFSVVG